MTPRPPAEIADPWAPYVPDPSAPWDVRRVVHLHRRAGFAATWAEIRRDLGDGPEAAVARLLAGTSRPAGVPEGFEATSDLLADAAVASADPARLKAWWVFRMAFGPDPLGERLTLAWHDHFATSNAKVEDLGLMRRQNDTLRRLARAPFGELLAAAVRDPALLNYLDAPSNRKGHPNENLARELMELFALGVGHYAEADVADSARALTGWTVDDGQFRVVADRHDAGPKAILGRAGAWTGDDLIGILLDQPAAARHLARRLVGTFFGEGGPGPAAIASLADRLRADGLDVGRGVATILRSGAFFDRGNLGDRVVGPVEALVGPARALELLDPPPSTLVLADWAARLGQDLFYPPNVGGWPGGRGWLGSRSVVARANFAAALVEGRGVGRPGPVDPLALLARHGLGPGDLARFLADLLLGGEPASGWIARVEAAGRAASTDAPDRAEPLRRMVAFALASPEAQLC